MNNEQKIHRCDHIHLKWLLEKGRFRNKTSFGKESTISMTKRLCVSTQASVHKPRSVHGQQKESLSDQREIWLWTIVISAYVLTIGTTRWGLSDDSDSDADTVNRSSGDWLDDWIRDWRLSGKSLTVWPWRQILDKIAWLETDDGQVFIRDVWQGAVHTPVA